MAKRTMGDFDEFRVTVRDVQMGTGVPPYRLRKVLEGDFGPQFFEILKEIQKKKGGAPVGVELD